VLVDREKKEKPLPFLKAMTIRNGGRSKEKEWYLADGSGQA